MKSQAQVELLAPELNKLIDAAEQVSGKIDDWALDEIYQEAKNAGYCAKHGDNPFKAYSGSEKIKSSLVEGWDDGHQTFTDAQEMINSDHSIDSDYDASA